MPLAETQPSLALEQPPAPPPSRWQRLLVQEDLNFLLTNRIPRRLATRFMGWFSKLPTGPQAHGGATLPP